MITPPSPRATIEDTPGGFRVHIPSARKPVFAFFVLVWLFLAVIFSRDLFTHVHTPADLAFSLCAAAFLLLWGAWAITSLLDSVWGRDVLVLAADSLILRHEIRGIGRDRTYALSDIRSLRVAPPLPDVIAIGSPLGVLTKGNGWIAFDYGSTTIRFGGAVDEAEARVIVQRLRQSSRALGAA